MLSSDCLMHQIHSDTTWANTFKTFHVQGAVPLSDTQPFYQHMSPLISSIAEPFFRFHWYRSDNDRVLPNGVVTFYHHY